MKVCAEAGVKHKGGMEVDRIMGVYRVVQSFTFFLTEFCNLIDHLVWLNLQFVVPSIET